MTIEFNGIEELMWCSAKIKKEDLLNKDQNFLISTAETLMSENSFRLFSTDINHKVDISGTSVKVNFQKPEIPVLNLQKNFFSQDYHQDIFFYVYSNVSKKIIAQGGGYKYKKNKKKIEGFGFSYNVDYIVELT